MSLHGCRAHTFIIRCYKRDFEYLRENGVVHATNKSKNRFDLLRPWTHKNETVMCFG